MIDEIVGGLLEPVGEILGELFGGLAELLCEGVADPLTAQQNKPREPTGGDWGGGPIER